ncbi:MAG: hypothetical protein KG012_01330 [Deltaproteobacteria bacterium]|nr:hypothetical protein [Deltaproteobacteria bacterium]
MIRDQENHISYEKWSELTGKEIFSYEEEKPKSLDKLYYMYGDDIEDEELSGSQSKRVKV